jgi:hypothetical protein
MMPKPVPLPKPADTMPADKAERLMRHCCDALALRNPGQRLDHIVRLAENDEDYRSYFMAVLHADPFSNADEADPRTWIIGIGIGTVLDAFERTARQMEGDA